MHQNLIQKIIKTRDDFYLITININTFNVHDKFLVRAKSLKESIRNWILLDEEVHIFFCLYWIQNIFCYLYLDHAMADTITKRILEEFEKLEISQFLIFGYNSGSLGVRQFHNLLPLELKDFHQETKIHFHKICLKYLDTLVDEIATWFEQESNIKDDVRRILNIEPMKLYG